MNVLISTWRDGVFSIGDDGVEHELPGESVGGLAADGRGGALAIVGGGELRRRTSDGTWNAILTGASGLACCVAVGGAIYVGTDDARVWRIDASGCAEPLPGFDACPGREAWYAGQALVNGALMGPPLGVRSMAATADGALLANVHVGGIARSSDRGATWTPTIDIDADVHEVRAHPRRPEIAVAAAGEGLCTSGDGGVTWSVATDGLHAKYCSAVALVGDDVLIAAATDHFANEGAVYRRSVLGDGALHEIGGGFPKRMGGIADTGCIAGLGGAIAIADRMGSVYWSRDAGVSWATAAQELSQPSGVLIVPE
jgi:hypothetical protein